MAPCWPSGCPTRRTTRSRSLASSASTRNLLAGATQNRARSLAVARDYLLEHRALLDAYVTDVFPVAEAQAAFELAVKPTAGRLKVVLKR